MKTKCIYFCVLFVLLLISSQSPAKSVVMTVNVDTTQVEKVYYAIEINGILCGYFEGTETPIQIDGKNFIQADINIFAMLSLLGSEFNQGIKIKAIIDPLTKKYSSVNTLIDQGSAKYNFDLQIKNDTAFMKSSLLSEARIIKLSPETVTGNDELFFRIKKDFLEKKLVETSYDVIEILEGEIQKSTIKKIGEEKLELSGKIYNSVILDQTNNKTGIKTKFWLCPEYDYFVKFEVQNRNIYLSDRSVVDKIKVSNMDVSFFTKSNVSISDIQAISYMKLKVKIEPTGFILEKKQLDVPGQNFEGTVADNVMEGILEIAHRRYDGVNAPAFPQDIGKNEGLKKYLEPDRFIESSDPVLVSKAREITTGAKDSWEAAKRLSGWVAKNISYAIPGGGTSRNTYDIRAGECGAHSMLLAAFCRAIGIPARIVFGAMYTPNLGGGFGQHAWNEIYMGEAGWIPVDATAHEIDFVDSGHIRISEIASITSTSFNGKKIDVLDYKLSSKSSEMATLEKDELAPYFGKYTNLTEGKTFTVLEKDGNLSVDVPGQMVLPFGAKDTQGKWQCKIAPQINIVFNKNEKGEINEMVLHQFLTLPRKSLADNNDKNVVPDFSPYLGKYTFAALNTEFTVFVNNGRLAVFDPTRKDTVELQGPREDGGRLDEFNKNIIYFEKDDQGNVINMKIDAINKFQRGELASAIIEDIISKEGLKNGIKKYVELRNEEANSVIFTEQSFNQLGYKYLNSDKISEAIEIFKLNALSNPESFNVYDSLGEAFMKNNQNELAIENYKKSLELNPKNENAVKMLQKLGIKQ